MKRSFSLMLCLGGVIYANFLAPVNAQTTSAACGGTSQPRCQITAPADQATTDYTKSYTDNITAWNTYSQSQINVSSNKFTWSFIPNIPTAACVNPMIDSPNGRGAVMMDVCSPLATFQTFINGVLAFFCLLGCVQQVRSALAIK
jgi:hypothetical protein